MAVNMKSSVYKPYIDRILEQSVTPSDIEEIAEKVAFQLDMPISELRDRIKNYLRRDSGIAYLYCRGEKRVILKSKLSPAKSPFDILYKVLSFSKEPIEQYDLSNILEQFDEFQTEEYNQETFLFEEGKDKIAFYYKIEPFKKNKNIRKDEFLVGLEEWDDIAGYWKLPNERAHISILKKYADTGWKLFEYFWSYYLGPYHTALEEIPFRVKTYSDDLTNLITQVFDISKLDEKNLEYYNNYLEYMMFIKTYKEHPNVKTNRTLKEWWLNTDREALIPILYAMCDENIRNSKYFYSKTKRKKK